ncbi:MAG: Calx-beta domain-containing protein [Candidatus Accumulibacter propinquus]
MLRVGDAVVDEASGLVQVALILDKPSLGEVTITYAVQAATAVSGSDFTVFPAGTIGFAPGETSKLVTVGILKDLTAESTEVFDVAVTSTTGATVGDGRGHVFINGNGSTPVVSPVLDLRNVLTVEGPGFVDFLVTLSAPSSSVVKVNYQTVAGTASSSDFKGQSGTLTFSAGETLKVIRLTTVDDATVEAQESFTLQLTSPINATLGNAIATATILDNDSPPPVSSVVLNGSTAGDILRGSPFADSITGGDGNDVLDGAGGDDNLAGGAGDDIYLIEDAGDSYTEAAAGGTDLVISYLSTLTLGANVENLQLAGSAITGIGNSLDNRITGSTENNTIEGGVGNDTIDGGAGLDTASYVGATGGVNVTLATSGVQQNTASAGLDTLISIENLTGSSFNDALTGNGGNNVLDGGAGNDTLNGGTGADTMLGGDGSDLYIVDHAGDVVTETNAAAAGGIDTVNALVDHTLGANVENLNLIAAGAVNGTGNALDNLIYAGAGNNIIDGAGGTDTVSYAFAGAGVTVSLATAGAQATGGSGSDTLISIENLTGSGFNDNLTGNAGNNVLDGGAGSDFLNGATGADTLLGGDGTDSYVVDNAGDLVSESNSSLATGGNDVVYSYVSAYTLTANVERLRLMLSGASNGTGNALDNILYASDGNNVLDGTAGNDTVSYAFAGAGVTVSLATAGTQATGGSGSDTLINIENLTGSGFNDVLTGNGGNNVLDGGAGNDTLNGGTGADTLLGGDGSDLYTVDHVGDVVTESNATAAGGIDTVNAQVDHTLGANVENLNLIAAGAVNGTGNALDNLIYAGAGNNVIDGAGGTDTVSYAFAGAGVTVSLATSAAQATGGSGSDTLINIENLTGSGFNDNLTGNAGNNVLDGGAGSDFLNGATGADTLVGGDGTDSYVVDNAGDLVSESNSSLATGGNDVVYSYVSAYTLTANVERLRLMLSGASNGTGNALDNILYASDGNNVLDGTAGNDTVSYAFAGAGVTVSLATAGAQATGGSGSDTLVSIENLIGSGFNDNLTGNAGNNVLDGGAGNDTLNGGAGADTMLGGDGSDLYIVDHAGDVVTETNAAPAGGIDTVNALVDHTLGANVENLNLIAAGAVNGTGNALDNLIYAGAGNNVIDGAGGTDTVSYAFAGAGVTVSLATAAAQATGGSGSDTLISIENLTGSSFNDSLTGNASNNVIDGGAGSDFLNGATGADTLLGGDGTDSYVVDNAGDLVSESNSSLATGGNDVVYSYVSAYTLTANVERLRLMLSGASNGTGNALDNILYAGDGANFIDGAGGTDTVSYVFAGAGVTVSLATAGAQATGGSGSDTLISIENLIGSGFNDNLTGNGGNNVLDGGAGNDTLNGGTGADTMLGGDGSDLYIVDHAGDVVTETNAAAAGGIDTVNALVDHTLGANIENLNLIAAGAVNGTGNSLNNLIYAGAGNNVIDGASGTDTVSYAFAGAGVSVSLATAGAQATGGSGSDTLISIENLTGSGFNDNLTGNAGNNVLDGGAGSDFLNGATGADTLVGGDGTDSYVVDNAGDLVSESNSSLATGGNDVVYSYVSAYTLTANVERLRLMLSGASNGTGNALDNILYASDGNNVLDGTAGNDTVSYAFAGAGVTVSLATAGAQATGGSGSDTLVSIENLIGSGFNDSLVGNTANNVLDGGAGSDFLNGGVGADTMLGGDGTDSYAVDHAGDLVTESNSSLATGGNDIVYSYLASYTLTANVERMRLMLGGASNGTGNALDNTLYAGAGDNVFDGTAGNDTVSYAFASAGVTVSLATAGAQATGGSGTDTLVSIENLIGSGFNDSLTGNGGNNLLDGGVGDDILIVGAGSDVLTGGSGSDTFDFNALSEMGLTNTTWDVITDFVHGTDKLDLSTLDADEALAGDQVFTDPVLGGTFSGVFASPGDLYFDTVAHVLYGNTDADTAAEFAIQLVGVTTLTAADLFL